MTNKPTRDDLTEKLDAPGWRLTDENPDRSVTGTLGEVLTESHARKSKGQSAGRIADIENAIELELFQIEQLWQHLGLPTI
ncbi:MAG TPA: hypothetical protein VHZ32_01220 [Rhizomicrobium sp.]|jgi:hypothetical protein|nr:hypothetical protein [Rhizomicrobium sp.]